MLYLAPYVGSGTKSDPFRPRAAAGKWSAVDLRPDPTVIDGFALLYLPGASGDAQLRQIGDAKEELLSRATETFIGNRLGKTFDGSNATISDLIGDLCLSPPSVKPWKSFLPALVNGRRQVEIWLNDERWFLQPVLAGGASDDFNRANETPIAAPWTKNGPGSNFNLTSNRMVKPSNGDDVCYYYSGAASSADQYTEFQITTFAGTSDCGPAVRIGTGATANYYVASYYTGGKVFYKYVSGSFSSISSFTDTETVNDYYRLAITGSSLTLYRDSSSPATTSRATASDSSITSGQPGVNSYDPGLEIDNWNGGDLGGGGGSGSDTGIVQMIESSTNLIRITVPEETA